MRKKGVGNEGRWRGGATGVEILDGRTISCGLWRVAGALSVCSCRFFADLDRPNRAWGSGVSFFFVLSGFILTYNYHDTFRDGIGRNDWIRYIVARLSRIAPVYLLALILGAILVFALRGTPMLGLPLNGATAGKWLIAGILNGLALQSFVPLSWIQESINAPAWSISCELFFYGLLPSAVMLVSRVKPSFGKTIIIAAGLVLMQLIFFELIVQLFVAGSTGSKLYSAQLFVDRFPPFRVFEFLVGCCAGYAFLVRESKSGALLLGSAFVGYLVVEAIRVNLDSLYFPRAVLLCPIFALAIYALASGGAAISKFLESGPVKLLGESSYSLYLVHWTPLMFLVSRYGWGRVPIGLAFAVMIGCIFLSILIYLEFERPARAYLRTRLLVRRGLGGPSVLDRT